MSKIYFSLFLFLINAANSKSQNISISSNGTLPNPQAILDVNSTNKGLLIPRVKLANNDNPINGIKPVGLMIWNDSSTYKGKGFYWWNGQNWQSLSYFSGNAISIDSVNNINVLENSIIQNGYVPAPGIENKNSIYQTDKQGNPSWKKINQTMYYIDKL